MSKPGQNPKNKANLLDQIRADIVSNNVCPDLAQTATNLVMGDGNPDAEIVFVGEAPGKNEDLQGLPFVGAAGKFLNEMLASSGMNRSDVYITNIVKYRPPNNRDPLPEEKKAFWPYLIKQIEVIQPKLIVTLGRHSMEYFLPEMRISQIHGQPKRIHLSLTDVGSQGHDDRIVSSARKQDELVMVILPLYHPAAALYNGGMRQTLIEDFGSIKQVIKLINESKQD